MTVITNLENFRVTDLYVPLLIMVARPLYLHPVVSFHLLSSSSFFPRLISAVGDWMSTILLHMAWP